MLSKITNSMAEIQRKEFETAYKIGIVKQLEQNGLLTGEQARQLVELQRKRQGGGP